MRDQDNGGVDLQCSPSQSPRRRRRARWDNVGPILTLHKLRVFQMVVEKQSLTLAANELMVSQPVVSDHIRDVEAFFGGRLLYQQGRRMLLNEAGQCVYAYVMDVLRSTEDTRSMVRLLETAEAGRAAIGASETPGAYRLPEQLIAFKLRYPKAEISLDIGSAYDIWDHIKHGVFDFAVVAGPEPPSELASEIYSREPIIVISSPAHPLARRTWVARSDLSDEPFVSITRRRSFDDRLRSLGLENPNIVMRVGNVEGLKHAVTSGLGLAVVFRCSVQRELASGELAELHVQGFADARPFYLVHSPRKRFSPLQIRLLNFLRAWPNSSQITVGPSVANRHDRDISPRIREGGGWPASPGLMLDTC